MGSGCGGRREGLINGEKGMVEEPPHAAGGGGREEEEGKQKGGWE